MKAKLIVTICRDVGDLSEDRVDEYLAFCERALLGPGGDGKPKVLWYWT